MFPLVVLANKTALLICKGFLALVFKAIKQIYKTLETPSFQTSKCSGLFIPISF